MRYFCFFWPCGAYSKFGERACTSHYIQIKILNQLVLADVRSKMSLVLADEKRAREEFLCRNEQQNTAEANADRKKLTQSTRRLAELDKLIGAVYEDKVPGKIPEEVCIHLLEKADGNVGFYAFDLSHFYSMIAFEYAQMHDLQKTLDALAESCRYAVIEANLKDMDYTAPMVNRLKYKKADTSKNYKGNACNLRLKALENRQFDFIREEDAFKKLIVMLEQNAE